MFHSRQILIHQLSEKSMCLLKIICQNFLRPSLVNDLIYEISFENYDNFLPIEEIFVGSECEKLLDTLPNIEVADFKRNCLLFYITSVEEIIKHLPLNDNIFIKIVFIDSNIALNHKCTIKNLYF